MELTFYLAVSAGVVNAMKRRQEEQRSRCSLPLGASCDSIRSDSTPSPTGQRHPQWGALPTRPPPMVPSPTDMPTYETPPAGHTPSCNHSNAVDTRSLAAMNQQHLPPTNRPGSLEGLPPHLSSWSTSGESSRTPGHAHQPHPPSSSHVTDSSYDSSVFAYSSSPSHHYTDSSSQATPSSSETTPSSISQGPRSIGSESGGTNILHFSYTELSEATGGFTEDMVGIGAFGTVFKARVRGNGPYAIKKLHTVSVG